jgi:hypothetical protein
MNNPYTRINRKTGAEIQLYTSYSASRYPHYILTCLDHSWRSGYLFKAEALASMAHPDTWCAVCRKLVQDGKKVTA